MADFVTGVAVVPGQAGSVHLTRLTWPVAGPGQAVVRVRRVGVCGTDREIIEAKFGTPPPGSTDLVLGHEVLGVVEAVGDGVEAFRPGDLVTATVRRPDDCPSCRAGQPDMCTGGRYEERGIIGLHGFMVDRFVEDVRYLVPVPAALEAVGVLVEPLSVVEKALREADLIQRRLAVWAPATAVVLGAGPIGLLGTMLLRARGMDVITVARTVAPNPAAALVAACGATYVSTRDTPIADLAAGLPNVDLVFEASGAASVAVDAMRLVGRNGVAVLLSLTGGDDALTVPIAAINREFVLGNKVLVGSVNSAREDFVAGVADLARFAVRWPGLTERLITTRLRGTGEAHRIAETATAGVKTVIEFGDD